MMNSLFRNFLYLSFSFVVVNISGYVFHAVVSRKLGPSRYAEFSVLYALMIALSRPVNILSNAVTRIAVTGRVAGLDFEKIKTFSMKLGIFVALILGVGTLLLSPVIQMFLKTESLFLFLPIGLTLFVWSLTGILRGLFTSIEAFGALSYASVVELLVRAVFGIIFVILGFEVFGALVSSAFGALFMFAILFNKRNYIAHIYNERKQKGISQNSFSNITAKFFFIALPTGFFLELDLMLAKRYFYTEEAGIYAASALIGKGLLLFSTVISSVVYPKMIEERLSKKGINAFLLGIGITVFLFVGGFFFLKFFGKPVVGLLFGDKYSGVTELVSSYVLAIMPLAIHLQIMNYKGAVGGWIEGIWLWLVLMGYYLSLELFSSGFYLYLKAIFIFHLMLTPVSFIILYLLNRKRDENDY